VFEEKVENKKEVNEVYNEQGINMVQGQIKSAD
jgi:hypothetical protein